MRDCTSSFRYVADSWAQTVLVDTPRSRAIARYDLPATSAWTTRPSAGVRHGGKGHAATVYVSDSPWTRSLTSRRAVTPSGQLAKSGTS
jgi:hypothetical protein